MSELKWNWAYYPYLDPPEKQAESALKAGYIKVVNKSEADKVIAHNKHKRCLAMARWCEATALWCYQAANTLPAGFHATLYGKPVMIEPDRLFERHALLTKWSARWRELAENFKETK